MHGISNSYVIPPVVLTPNLVLIRDQASHSIIGGPFGSHADDPSLYVVSDARLLDMGFGGRPSRSKLVSHLGGGGNLEGEEKSNRRISSC